jgi:hypothetical protein
MKRADDAREGICEKDQATSALIIATAIERYTGIFNDLDPAPFKKRDVRNKKKHYERFTREKIRFKYASAKPPNA